MIEIWGDPIIDARRACNGRRACGMTVVFIRQPPRGITNGSRVETSVYALPPSTLVMPPYPEFLSSNDSLYKSSPLHKCNQNIEHG